MTDFLMKKWWVGLILLGVLAIAVVMVVTGSDEEGCPDGMERTADTEGHCCWPGQVYLEDRCVGLPTSCPEGTTVSETDQACVHPDCEGGRVRASDGVHCCWEGQGWSQTREQCVGVPTSCPAGLALSEEDCIFSAPEGFVAIEAGAFIMGSPEDEEHRNAERERAQEVRISRSFLLKDTPVTQGEWFAMTTDPATGVRTNPTRFKDCGDDCPVEQISWFEAVTYLNWLSEQEGLEACYEMQCRGNFGFGCSDQGERSSSSCVGSYRCSSVEFKGLDCEGYRLPTQAEWEFAARAGTTEVRYGSLDRIAWYSGNSDGETKPVRAKEPNAWGLYDMFGNVSEWTNDFAFTPTNLEGPTTFPTGAVIIRGCSYNSYAFSCRAAASGISGSVFVSSTIGFRPARSLP